MSEKFTYTVNLPEAEADILCHLAMQKGMTKTNVFRQALRLYQLVSSCDSVEIVLKGQRTKLVP